MRIGQPAAGLSHRAATASTVGLRAGIGHPTALGLAQVGLFLLVESPFSLLLHVFGELLALCVIFGLEGQAVGLGESGLRSAHLGAYGSSWHCGRFRCCCWSSDP